MNALIEGLNDVAAAWWTVVLYASWQSALVAAVVLVVVVLLRRLPSPLRYGLVVVAMVKFLMPPFLALPFAALSQVSVARVENHPITTPGAALRPAEPPLAHESDYPLPLNRTTGDVNRNSEPTAADGDEAGPSETPETPSPGGDFAAGAASPPVPLHRPRITWRAVLMLVHAVGLIVMAGWVLIQCRYVRALLASAHQVDDGPLFDVFRRLITEMGVRRQVRLMVSSESIAPMAVGVVRPAVVIPSSLIRRLSADELRTILAHELAHHRRFDLPVLRLQAVVLSLWWFHPLAWIVNRALLRLREQCCDDLVLERDVTTAGGYSHALTRAVEWCSLRSMRRDLGWIASPMHPLGRRLERVMDTTLPRRSRLSASGLIGLALAASVLLPGVTRDRARGGDGASEASAPQTLPPLAADAPPGEGLDLYGDPLPAGVIARLGTLRYRHGGAGTGPVAFLRDSTTVLSIQRAWDWSGSGSLRLWDMKTGKTLNERRLDNGAIAASDPFPDGENVAVLGVHDAKSLDRQLKCTLAVWNASSNTTREIASWVDESANWTASRLAVSRDGRVIGVGAASGRVRLFNVKTRGAVADHAFARQKVAGIDFSADGNLVAVATTRGVFLWAWRTDRGPQRILGGIAQTAVFSPTGRHVAIRLSGGRVRLWDVAARRFAPQFDDSVRDSPGDVVAFLPDGEHLVVPRGDTHRFEVIEVPSGKRVRAIEGVSEVFAMAVSPDGRFLAASVGTAAINVWDLQGGQRLNARARGHNTAPREIAFTPDGKQVVTGAEFRPPGTIRIWDAESGKHVRTLRHDHIVMATAISPDGKLIASSSLYGPVQGWDVDSGQVLFKGPGHGDSGSNNSFKLAFTRDGRRLLSFGDDWNLRTWDAQSGRFVAQQTIRPRELVYQPGKDGVMRAAKFKLSHYDKIATRDAVTCVQFSADRQSLLFTSWPIGGFPPGLKTNYEVEIASGRGVDQYRVDDNLRELVVSPKGDLVATVEWRRPPAKLQHEAVKLGLDASRYFLRLRDAVTKDLVRTIELPGNGQHGAFSPDGSRFALSISQRTGPDQMERWIGVWDTASGEKFAQVEGYRGQPFALAFSPDGHRLASSHEDSTVLIWDLEQFRDKRSRRRAQ